MSKAVQCPNCSHVFTPTKPVMIKLVQPNGLLVPKPKVESTSKLEESTWKAFSKLVRMEAGNICEIHALAAERNVILPFDCTPKALQCCHKFSAKYHAIKYNRRNVYSGCAGGNGWEWFNRYKTGKWESVWKQIWPEDWAYLNPIKGARATRDRMNLTRMRDEFRRQLKGLGHG